MCIIAWVVFASLTYITVRLVKIVVGGCDTTKMTVSTCSEFTILLPVK